MRLTKHGRRQCRLQGALLASLIWVAVMGFYSYAWKQNFDASIAALRSDLAPMVRYAKQGLELQQAVMVMAEREGE